MGYPDSHLRRTDRIYNAALALLLHRNGPLATPSEAEVDKCIAFAVALNVKVDAALGAAQPFPPEGK